jgi:hypothetical protein
MVRKGNPKNIQAIDDVCGVRRSPVWAPSRRPCSAGSVTNAWPAARDRQQCRDQSQEMPAEDQACSERDDHYRDVVSLAGAIGRRSRAAATISARGHAASAALVSIVPTEHLRSLASSEASSSRPTLADRSPPLGPAHHHVNLAAAASRAPKPVAPVEHGRPVAIPPGLLGWVWFDPILARFARADCRHSPTP